MSSLLLCSLLSFSNLFFGALVRVKIGITTASVLHDIPPQCILVLYNSGVYGVVSTVIRSTPWLSCRRYRTATRTIAGVQSPGGYRSTNQLVDDHLANCRGLSLHASMHEMNCRFGEFCRCAPPCDRCNLPDRIKISVAPLPVPPGECSMRDERLAERKKKKGSSTLVQCGSGLADAKLWSTTLPAKVITQG